MTSVPSRGNNRTSQAKVVALTGGPRSSLELPQLIDINRKLATVDRDDHAEPDADLASGDGHHDQREDLPVAVAPHARERDEREVGAVEHELEAQQHHEGVAPGDHADD